MSIDWSEDDKRNIQELIAEGWSRENAEMYIRLTTDDVVGYKGPRAPERWWELTVDEWPGSPNPSKRESEAKPKS